jgi:hypothetical protein
VRTSRWWGLGLCGLGALATISGACHDNDGAVLLMVVTASGSPPATSALTVMVSGPAGASSQRYAPVGGQTIAFPTTLTAELPSRALGSLSLDVAAQDASGATVATGHAGPLTVAGGERPTVYVELDCAGGPCLVDAGLSAPADGAAAASPRCGNGVVDPGETCDSAIARGDPGACPPADCDDGVACTRDTRTGADCTATCAHEEITVFTPNDGCCPAGATIATDSDCSPTCGDGKVDPGETCDTGLAAGIPGACPAASDCAKDDPCAVALLVSAGTCSAICVRYQVLAPLSGDGCCPPGALNGVDTDCPVACGDGVRESGEACDTGISPPAPGSCPAGCDDGDPCTADFLAGTGCQAACAHVQITAQISGDGCCPAGATAATDTDCPASCGDGVVERGETCDPKATGAGACPTSCPPSPSPCLQMVLAGSAGDCSARCVPSQVATCSSQSDGCCPSGCTAASDPDCSASCGDGVVQPGEACDIAIPAGMVGACPSGCADGDPCTEDLLLSAGTCSATCAHPGVTAALAGDGCCPPGANFTTDPDCAPICGNGVVEPPVEACDDAAGEGSCPTSCPAAGSCTKVTPRGSAATCSASCTATPITACVGGDGCCPAGCTALDDSDCPVVCGDGVVEPGELCDRGITSGMPGACARSCDDADACTVDLAAGSVAGCTRVCRHETITACLDDDGCCPAGCSVATDSDCGPRCGDARIGAGETCDPPTTCPTACPDDGDPCTREELTGDPAHCNATCRHVPITSCSGSHADFCCPTGCTAATDSDC